MSNLSVIILTHNEKDHIRPCLDSVFAQKADNCEIIVIDNGSADGSAEYVKENWPEIMIIENAENRGVAVGRNQGINASTGEYIMFLDADARLTDNTLQGLIDFHKNEPKAAIVGPKIKYPSGAIQYSCRTFPTLLTVIWRGTSLYKKFPGASFYEKHLYLTKGSEQTRKVDWVLGACQMIKRKALDDIGLLDEKYFFGYEDIDLCWRAGQKGWDVYYYPEALAIHDYQRKSSKGFISKIKIEHIKSILRFWRKKYVPK